VRHPGYLAKNLFWLVTLLPAFVPYTAGPNFSWLNYWLSCVCIVCGFVCWGTIYFLRAVTEERFLSHDPDYVAYCQRVKWRFIPGVY
jgi:protein-S-isoprenylcysteine O-methyltransferase Ste14